MTEHIVLCGAGRVGNTTLAASIAAALAETGFRVLLVGWKPGGESTVLLHTRETASAVTISLGEGDRQAPDGQSASLAGMVGRIAAIETAVSPGIDYVLYDILLADLQEGEGYVLPPELKRVFLVSSSDLGALASANDFIGTVSRQGDGGEVSCCLIANGLHGGFEESLVCDFARTIRARIVGAIPRSLLVTQSEFYGKTVIEVAPQSNLAHHLRRLARQVIAAETAVPLAGTEPLSPERFRAWAHGWGDRIGELEFGIQQDGGGI